MTISRLIIPEGHDDSIFIVSVSGGKDSTATLLAMREAGIPHRAVFADTGWEAAETYEYLTTLERLLGITIDRVRSEKGGMVDIARHKAGFPTRKGKWCTEELKLKPLRAYHDKAAESADCETVSVVGIRADESRARSAMKPFEYSDLWGGMCGGRSSRGPSLTCSRCTTATAFRFIRTISGGMSALGAGRA